MFIAPMLAAPLKGWTLQPGEWHAEEKFDGIRLIVEVLHDVPEDLLSTFTVRTWSRDGIAHAVPRHVREALGKLPTGIYDAELYVPGKRSYGATRLDQQERLCVVVFDILQLNGTNTMDVPLRYRRNLLLEIFERPFIRTLAPLVHLAEARILHSMADMETFRDEVWARDGEGLILKALASLYAPGKRNRKLWVKVKDLKSDVLTVVGFQPSRGEIVNRGPYAMAVLQNEKGIVTTVKTRNDAEIARLERAAVAGTKHPWIGRKLRIEFQEHTPDGNYRHPRWDRWEDE